MTNAPAPTPSTRKRCIIYVDSFNWYFGVFRDRPAWKWLNPQSFFEALRPDEEVIAVKLFTAIVEPKRPVSAKRDRQRRYLKALGSLSKVQVILGTYQERTVKCGAPACPRQLEYRVPEEKKSDVNLALNLIEDALESRTDSMVIVSGDSDLEPAVEWVRNRYPKIKISVYIPVLAEKANERRNDHYHQMGVICKALPLADIARHQFPAEVVLGEKQTVKRPEEWR